MEPRGEEARQRAEGTSSAHIPKEKMSTAVPSLTSEMGRTRQGWSVGCASRSGALEPLKDSPPYSGGKKCRFRSSSRSARMGLRRSSGSAKEERGAEQTSFSMVPTPQRPHAPLEKMRYHTAMANAERKSRRQQAGTLGSLCPGLPQVPQPGPLSRPASPAPEPILMRPLC